MQLKHNFKLFIYLGLILALFTCFPTGCQNKEPREDLASPPEIPPVSSLVMDFADFNPQGKVSLIPSNTVGAVQQVSFISESSSSYSSDQYAMGTRKNWGFAVLNVGFWSVLIVVGLAGTDDRCSTLLSFGLLINAN